MENKTKSKEIKIGYYGANNMWYIKVYQEGKKPEYIPNPFNSKKAMDLARVSIKYFTEIILKNKTDIKIID